VVTNPSLSMVVTNPGFSSKQKKSYFGKCPIDGETDDEIEALGL